ncbi:MFS transporter [Rhodovibrio salinarum]|nr:MFS transporter [Rhodovibrio salinarum]
MFIAIRSSWPLFLGVALMMLGSGLQTSLLGVRAGLEAFDTSATGLIMSMYFVGFLAGSLLVPRMIGQVGHVRVFAALASIASTATLVHVVFVEPVTWAVVRMLTGFAFAGLFIVAESWLNDRATNQTRGSLLAVYMVVMLGGTAAGQLLLNLDDPTRFQLFALVSVLISLSLVPLLLSATPAPAIQVPEKVGVRQLYRASPLGVVGCFGTGIAHGAALGMGAVYAGAAGFTLAEISAFMGAIYLGGMLAQAPIGVLSDRFDRRLVLTVTTLAAAAAAVAAGWGMGVSNAATIGLAAVLGGLTLPLYALCVSHTNDYLTPTQMPAASGRLYLVTGVGATLGPLAVALLMDLQGPVAYFGFLAAVHLAIGVFALWRMTRRAAKPLEEQGHYASLSSTATQVAAVMVAEEAVEHQPEEAETDWVTAGDVLSAETAAMDAANDDETPAVREA